MLTDEQIKRMTDYLFLPADLKPCDIGLVFGTRMQEPVSRAYEAYSLGLVPYLLLSGGANRHTGVVEAHDMAERLERLGVPRDSLLLEDRSANSLENVVFSRDLIAETLGLDRVRSVLVVAKHYHMRRAVMTLKRHFPDDTKFRPFPYEVLGFTRDNWLDVEAGREKVLSEWEKIPKYLAKGDLAEL
jgi:uncharacterized SAM-binding protein YcdF (DUF218 family)